MPSLIGNDHKDMFKRVYLITFKKRFFQLKLSNKNKPSPVILVRREGRVQGGGGAHFR